MLAWCILHNKQADQVMYTSFSHSMADQAPIPPIQKMCISHKHHEKRRSDFLPSSRSEQRRQAQLTPKNQTRCWNKTVMSAGYETDSSQTSPVLKARTVIITRETYKRAHGQRCSCKASNQHSSRAQHLEEPTQKLHSLVFLPQEVGWNHQHGCQ